MTTINQRIRELVLTHGLTGLARKAAVSPASVHRYVNGARVPLEFCARIARELSLNPAWVLHGTGSPDLGGSAESAANMADDVRVLVETMAETEHVKLGALAGDPNLRRIRELSDAMRRYEAIRGRLNQLTANSMRALLADLRMAVNNRDVSSVMPLLDTATLLSQICTDPHLLQELQVLQSNVEGFPKNADTMNQMAQRIFRLAMLPGEGLGNDELEILGANINMLCGLGRFQEARILGRAALELAAIIEPCLGELRVRAELASAYMHLGELQSALELIAKMSGRPAGQHRQVVDAVTMRALLLAGLIEFPAALRVRESSPRVTRYLLQFAMIFENENQLDIAIKYASSQTAVKLDSEILNNPCAVLYALQGDRRAAMTNLNKYVGMGVMEGIPMNISVLRQVQVYRLIGMTEEAKRCHRKAVRDLKTAPKWFFPGLNNSIIHHRNSIALGTAKEKKMSTSYLQSLIEAGYAGLNPVFEA